MEDSGLNVVLSSSDANPFREHEDEIAQLLGVQGFVKINLTTEESLLQEARGEVDKLDKNKRLYAPAEVLIEGLLGDEGSTRICEISSFDKETRALERLSQGIEAVSESMQHYLTSCGYAQCERTSLLVHRGGLDMAIPVEMSAEEAMRFKTIFGRHILMVLVFLGPGEGTLELQPFDVDADAQEIRTKPGSVVVLRPDLLAHRHIPEGDDSVLSCWMLVPSSAGTRSGETALMQTAVVQELDKYTHQKFLEVKAMQESDEEPTMEIPLAMQMEINRRFFAGCRAAVRGIGCKLPGSHISETYFKSIGGGVDYVTDIPMSRWDHNRYYDPAPDSYESIGKTNKVKTNIKHEAFIEGVDLFDNKFFGLSAAEARCTSPDQKLTLECAYEAMREAGYTKQTLTKKAEYLGVFMGTGLIDFGAAEKCSDAVGMALGGSTVSAARTSFALGMRGPCITFDNEAASSMIAVILAVQSVVPSNDRWSKAGNDCNHSLGGASKINTTCFNWTRYGYWMNPVGRCFCFDENARGHVDGEAVAMICVGSLTAKVDGKHVIQEEADRGSICGWRLNNNGINSSMTAPSGTQQQECISMAIRQAGLKPSDIDAVETHGSSQQLDDAIEATSLGLCLRGDDESMAEVLHLGSMKTNTGHTIEVGGALAILKVAYCQSYLTNMPNIHLKTLNPNIDMDETTPLQFQSETVPYRALSSYHGISSHSMNGTNAHVIMWGNVDVNKVQLTAKSLAGQQLVYWPGGGGKLDAGSKAVIGYSIAGSMNGWESVEMTNEDNGVFTHTITIGDNRFETFQIWLDGDHNRALCPGAARAMQGSAVEGPVAYDVGQTWRICDCNPGDRFKVSFKTAGKYRAVTWEKTHAASDKDEMQASMLNARYYVAGDFNDWQPCEMRQQEERPGTHTAYVRSRGLESGAFVIMRNLDWNQTFHSSFEDDGVDGPIRYDWQVRPFQLPRSTRGDAFKIDFCRFIDFGVDDKTISFKKVSKEECP